MEVQCAKIVFGHLCEIGMVLYERIIKRLIDFIDFDCATAVLAVECFLVILHIISNHHKSNFKSFLSKVGGRDDEEELVFHLTDFMETYQKLFEIDENEVSEDPEIKKLSLVVINTINFLWQQIPATNNTLALQMMEWLKNVAINKNISSKQTATGFVNLLFDCHIKFKVSLTFFEQVAVRLGDVTGVINEEEHNVEEFKIITELTVNNVFVSLCNSLKAVLEDIDWIIARLKSEYSMIIYPGETDIERKREYLKSKERGVCCQLCFIVTILTNLSNCTVPPGNLSEAVLKNLILLYNTLSSLTKYFVLRSSKINPVFQGARFERLVKLAGKQLAPVVYKLIMYIEESQKQEPETTQKKKRNVDSSTLKSKVLKETRLIPKVVYEIEQFSKYVIQLSNKTKIDLSKFVGQGTVRDFRILHLKEVLEQAKDGAAPVTQATQESDSTLIDNNENETSGEESSPPPTKKTKS
ncbi:Fanconi anemia group I protein -like [Asbolus verrucosus]|uniref:Fanconi anemia group I protein-like n=1 Tax=Asbolus verrucosus TaxID=1661398 RepID=A0A482VIV3_ASBVE|nr:Fanconi anemia group I protein -like [Asbolus verrucosus]